MSDRDSPPAVSDRGKFNRLFVRFLRLVLIISFWGVISGHEVLLWLFVSDLVLLTTIMAIGMFLPNSAMFGPVLSFDSSRDNVVYLTFDDGPCPKNTPEVLEILRKTGVVATFFVVGTNAAIHPELVRQMSKDGHSVQNHTWTHSAVQAVFPLYRRTRLKSEFQKCNDLIAQLSGKPPRFIRFPAGVKSLPMMEVASELGMIVTGFSLRFYDSSGTVSVERVLSKVKKNIFPGAIIVLHDKSRLSDSSFSPAVLALPHIISWLQEHNYRLATLPSMGSVCGGLE